MDVKVKMFGPQARIAGSEEVIVATRQPEPTCAMVRQALARQVPALAPSLPASRLAVNHEYADEDQRLGESDEVVLIGMTSAG